MKFKGEIKGMNKLLKKLGSLGSDGIKRIAQTTESNAREIEARAKQLAPLDLGVLRSNIKALNLDKGAWVVRANANGTAPYSAYQEFGTGGLVSVSEEMKDIAILFKGRGVKEVNLNPQPFLYPAFVEGRKNYIKDLKDDIKDLTKKI